MQEEEEEEEDCWENFFKGQEEEEEDCWEDFFKVQVEEDHCWGDFLTPPVVVVTLGVVVPTEGVPEGETGVEVPAGIIRLGLPCSCSWTMASPPTTHSRPRTHCPPPTARIQTASYALYSTPTRGSAARRPQHTPRHCLTQRPSSMLSLEALFSRLQPPLSQHPTPRQHRHSY